MNDDHKTLLARDIDLTPKYSAIGVSPSMLANRISWMFDLKGPSMNLDSACSSSLMALDIACQALRSGDTCMVGKQFLKDELQLTSGSRHLLGA